MDEDRQLQQRLEMFAAYHRHVALAGLDEPLGEEREARLVEAIEQCADLYSEPALADLQRQRITSRCPSCRLPCNECAFL